MEFVTLLKSAFSPLQKQETLSYHLKGFFFLLQVLILRRVWCLSALQGKQHLPEVEPGQGVSEQTRVRGGSRV